MLPSTRLSLIRALRLVTLLLVTQSMGMGVAHVLERPVKAEYDDQLYATVNNSLYNTFGPVSSIVFPAEILAAAALAVLLYHHGRVGFGLACAGTVLLAASLAAWMLVVSPINAQARSALLNSPATDTATVRPDVMRPPTPPIVEVWRRDRGLWEWGHQLTFALQLSGFIALVLSGLVNEQLGTDPPHTAHVKLSVGSIVL